MAADFYGNRRRKRIKLEQKFGPIFKNIPTVTEQLCYIHCDLMRSEKNSCTSFQKILHTVYSLTVGYRCNWSSHQTPFPNFVRTDPSTHILTITPSVS